MSKYSLSENYLEIPGLNNKVHKPKIVGLIRERNESLILQDTLDEMAKIADTIIVFDDSSQDNSLAIALKHPRVSKVILNQSWNASVDRSKEETWQRGAVLTVGMSYKPKWIFYQDADERVEHPEKLREFLLENTKNPNIASVRLSLYDAYMTKRDQEPYTGGKLYGFRKMYGIERREITMAWKPSKEVYYPEDIPDLRIPVGIDPGKTVKKFFVQHYGKSLSIKQWEETCDYYIEHFPEYAEKWKKRKGKGVHRDKSDFNTPLLTWEEVKKAPGVLIP